MYVSRSPTANSGLEIVVEDDEIKLDPKAFRPAPWE